MNRRKILIGGGVVGVIGLFGYSTVSALGGSTRPEGPPSNIPAALQCTDDEVQRLWKGYDEGEVAWGDAESFALRVNKQSFDYGETATITLTNKSFSRSLTGNKGTYNFELYTEAGWQEVRVTDGDRAIPGSQVIHPPGGGFEWEVPLTEDGIQSQWNEVCPDLQSGRYRFTYWALEDSAIAVAFDIHRET